MSIEPTTAGWKVTCDSGSFEDNHCTTVTQVGLGYPPTIDHLHDELRHQGWFIHALGTAGTRYHCPSHNAAGQAAYDEALATHLSPIPRCPQCDSIGETGCPNPYHDQDRPAAYARSEPERRIVGFEITDRFGEGSEGLITQIFRRSELPWDARIIDAAYSRIVRQLDSEEPSLRERFIIVAAYPLCAYSSWRIRRVVTWRSE